MKLFSINFEYMFPDGNRYYNDKAHVLAKDEERANIVFREWVLNEEPDTILTSVGITELPEVEQVLPNY